MAAAIRKASNDQSVKGIVVRIDSRGGSAVASDSIRRELQQVTSFGAKSPTATHQLQLTNSKSSTKHWHDLAL